MFMEEKDYRLVFVGNTQVGLIGLKDIFEELKTQKGRPESDLKQMLAEKAGRKNYIAPSVREKYEKALFQEFKKFLGEKVEENKSEFLEVAILGPGCYSCNKLEQDVMAVLSETGIKAGLNHITDPSLIAQYGILPSPALIINGKVKSAGRVPSKSMIKKWLEEEQG
jgi:small redox-active disulfide protein 2